MNLPLASWLESRMGFPCRHFSQIGLQTASDHEVFRLAEEVAREVRGPSRARSRRS